jgi:hypothetical protein
MNRSSRRRSELKRPKKRKNAPHFRLPELGKSTNAVRRQTEADAVQYKIPRFERIPYRGCPFVMANGSRVNTETGISK